MNQVAMTAKKSLARSAFVALVALTAAASVGCTAPRSAADLRTPAAEKWYRRALADYRAADVDEARDSVRKALSSAPNDQDVRLLAGNIALARLEYDEVLRLLKDLPGSEAAGLRGRALWYKGELDEAADALEAMLNDPEVVDPWAKQIAKLARQGTGRTPFALSGGLLASVEMVPINPYSPFFVVSVEIDGESALALIATGTPEVVLDSSSRKEASWTSIRFGQNVEVHDVPAQVLDLSGISKQVGAPIHALLGVNLLRHLNATIDFEGRQFVVRSFAPPTPPESTRVGLAYVKGGGMVVGAGLGPNAGERGALIVDTAMNFPLALDKAGWSKSGVDPASLQFVTDDPEQKFRAGTVSTLRLGALDITQVPGVLGAPIETVEKALAFDIDGSLGAGLLAHYRITFGDGGRLMWLEDHETIDRALLGAPGSRPPPPSELEPPALDLTTPDPLLPRIPSNEAEPARSKPKSKSTHPR
jgi:hypothetical protein